MVECLPSKQTVAGSSPVPRSNLRRLPGARLLQSNTLGRIADCRGAPGGLEWRATGLMRARHRSGCASGMTSGQGTHAGSSSTGHWRTGCSARRGSPNTVLQPPTRRSASALTRWPSHAHRARKPIRSLEFASPWNLKRDEIAKTPGRSVGWIPPGYLADHTGFAPSGSHTSKSTYP